MSEDAIIKPLFTRGPSATVRVVLAVSLALGLIIADHHYGALDRVRAALALAAYPLQQAAHAPSWLLPLVRERLADTAELRAEQVALQRENLLLKARVQQFDALTAENARLRTLLGSSHDLDERVLIAEIVGMELDPYRQLVRVNKGTKSGVFMGQPVLDANAVMGQVIRAEPFSAIVLLITDADHALPVEVNRTGLRTIAAGTGPDQQLELLYIPKNADLQVGDLLVTSGLDGRFPGGYPVARVKEISQDPANPFTSVIAEPTARLDRSREVLLVWSLAGHTQQPAIAAQPAAHERKDQ